VTPERRGDKLVIRYVPEVRMLGRWPFRQRSWQVWDRDTCDWASNAACGGAFEAADWVCREMNEYERENQRP
jgi:hypothetical protein